MARAKVHSAPEAIEIEDSDDEQALFDPMFDTAAVGMAGAGPSGSGAVATEAQAAVHVLVNDGDDSESELEAGGSADDRDGSLAA